MKVCNGSKAWTGVAQFQGKAYFSHFFYSIYSPHLWNRDSLPCNGDIWIPNGAIFESHIVRFCSRLEKLFTLRDKIIKIEHTNVYLRWWVGEPNMITSRNHGGIMKYLKWPLLLWYLWTLGMCLKLDVSQHDEIATKKLVEDEQTTNTS